jgi:hypothetical protein
MQTFKVTEPWSHTKKSIDGMVEVVLRNTDATDYQIYLSGEGNYREERATTRPYKGNRDRSKTPDNLPEARQYLIDDYEAFVVDGAEADDALGINQTEDTCIATSDKDLDMVEGMHYSIYHNNLYYVSPEEAIRFFYTQLLTGDSTDNIVGVRGVGEKTAHKVLKGVSNEVEMYQRVLDMYEKVYRADGYDMLREMADLLWIQREWGVLWTPPS